MAQETPTNSAKPSNYDDKASAQADPSNVLVNIVSAWLDAAPDCIRTAILSKLQNPAAGTGPAPTPVGAAGTASNAEPTSGPRKTRKRSRKWDELQLGLGKDTRRTLACRFGSFCHNKHKGCPFSHKPGILPKKKRKKNKRSAGARMRRKAAKKERKKKKRAETLARRAQNK